MISRTGRHARPARSGAGAVRLSRVRRPRFYERLQTRTLPEGWDTDLPTFDADPKGVATRKASGAGAQRARRAGSPSCGAARPTSPSPTTPPSRARRRSPPPSAPPRMWKADPYAGRVLHFGIREHGMGAILNGIAAARRHPRLRRHVPHVLRLHAPSVRLASIMQLPVTYVWTHDSIGLGEDGPTHQPIEHLAALRAIPGLDVVRPADANETAACWQTILAHTDRPAGLVLTRQNVPVFPRGDDGFADTSNVHRGGYVLLEAPDLDGRSGQPDVVLIGTGSEVQLAVEARDLLADARRPRPGRLDAVPRVVRRAGGVLPRDGRAAGCEGARLGRGRRSRRAGARSWATTAGSSRSSSTARPPTTPASTGSTASPPRRSRTRPTTASERPAADSPPRPPAGPREGGTPDVHQPTAAADRGRGLDLARRPVPRTARDRQPGRPDEEQPRRRRDHATRRSSRRRSPTASGTTRRSASWPPPAPTSTARPARSPPTTSATPAASCGRCSTRPTASTAGSRSRSPPGSPTTPRRRSVRPPTSGRRWASPTSSSRSPATTEGWPAITETLAAGISVNVTLIFGLDQYREVMEAYVAGLEQAADNGHDLSRDPLGRVVLRLPRRHRDRQAARGHHLRPRHRPRPARQGRRGQRPAGVPDVRGVLLRRPLGGARGAGRPQAASAVGLHRRQEPRLRRHDVRRRPGRRGHRQHDAREDPGGRRRPRRGPRRPGAPVLRRRRGAHEGAGRGRDRLRRRHRGPDQGGRRQVRRRLGRSMLETLEESLEAARA